MKPSTVEISHLAPHLIHPTPENPRNAIDQTAPSFLEMVESVRTMGLLQPILGRPHPDLAGCIDLRAGERRYRACCAAGFETIPIIVRDMDDKTAMEVTVLENLQRSDLSPLEEARGIQALLSTGHDHNQIAAELGKSPAWCARRAKLLSLTPDWQTYAKENTVGAAHLELIARLPDEVQTHLYQETTGSSYYGDELFHGPESLGNLKNTLADLMHSLKLAPFPTDDDILVPAAGACLTCPKRSGCQPSLFEEENQAGGDTCLDSACWDTKRKAHLERTEAALRVKHPGLIRVVGEDAPWSGENGNLLRNHEYKEVKKTTPGAVPALIVAGKGEGVVKYIVPEKGYSQAAKTIGKANAAAAGAGDEKAGAAVLEEKRAHLENRRWCHVAASLKATLEESSGKLIPGSDATTVRIDQLLPLVACFGTDFCIGAMELEKWKTIDMDRIEGWMSVESITAIVWARLVPKLTAELFIESASAYGIRHAEAITGISKLLGIDMQLLYADACAALPEPKSWTPKEPKPAKPAKETPAATEAPKPKGKKAAPAPADEWTPPETPAFPKVKGKVKQKGVA